MRPRIRLIYNRKMKARGILTISLLFMAINFCHAQRVMSAEDVIRSSGGRISFFEGIYRETRPQFVSWRSFNPVTLDDAFDKFSDWTTSDSQRVFPSLLQ